MRCADDGDGLCPSSAPNITLWGKEPHFGMGTETVAETIEIRWPRRNPSNPEECAHRPNSSGRRVFWQCGGKGNHRRGEIINTTHRLAVYLMVFSESCWLSRPNLPSKCGSHLP